MSIVTEPDADSGACGVVDPPPPPLGDDPGVSRTEASDSIEHFRDSRPTGIIRSSDLPQSSPPSVELVGQFVNRAVVAELRLGESAVSTRWECLGEVQPDGLRALWVPASEDDQLSVAVRGQGGVSFATLRARDVVR